MKKHYHTVREAIRLWLAIAIVLVLSALTVSVRMAQQVDVYFRQWTNLPVADWLSEFLFVALLVLLWRAYRHWLGAVEREEDLEKVIASISPDVLLVVLPNRTITMCNSAVRSMFDYEMSEVVQQKTDLLYFDRRVTGQPGEIFESLQKVGFHIGYAKGRRKDGDVFPLEIVTSDLKGAPGAVVLIRDITERRRAEEQLVKAKESAEAANREKDAALVRLEENYARLKELEQMRDSLTHMIVHDLKTPLFGIRGYLTLVQSHPSQTSDERITGYLQEASKLASLMTEMINSLLDIGRLEKKEMALSLEPCDMSSVARDALKIIGSEVGARVITVEAKTEPVLAYCDRDIVRRILTNLVGNAVKFTLPEGTIRICLEPRGDRTRISVIDNGSGIPQEFHRRIFEPFTQLEVRKYSSGLGLAFCKLAVEAHGGQIDVISDVGCGSTFWFELPSHLPAVPSHALGRAHAFEPASSRT